LSLKAFSEVRGEEPGYKAQLGDVEENVLRQRVTTDVSTGSGQFRHCFYRLYETPIFAKRGLAAPHGKFIARLRPRRRLQVARDGLSYDGKLYALPFLR